FVSCFCDCYGDPRDLRSFPTRRSSDLVVAGREVEEAVAAFAVGGEGARDVGALDRHSGARESKAGGVSDAAGDDSSRDLSQGRRSEEHTSELQSLAYLVCRLLLEKKNP